MTQPTESDDRMQSIQRLFPTLSDAEQIALLRALDRHQTIHYGMQNLTGGLTGEVRLTNSTVYGPVIGINAGVVFALSQTTGMASPHHSVGLPRTRHPIGYAAIHQALYATWAEVCQTNTPTWAVLTGARGMGRLPLALTLGRMAVADGGQMVALSFAPDAAIPPLDPTYTAAIRTQWPQNTEVLGDPWLQLIAQQWPSFDAIPTTITRWGLDGAGALRDVLYAGNRPLVLILDGWEYAPEPWITLLRGLPSRGHASYPILLLATITLTAPWESMMEESHPAAMAIRGQSQYPVVVHSCHGVNQTDIAIALGIAPESELAIMLAAWSGGHPGIVEYLWDDWCDQGWIALQQQGWQLTQPIEVPTTYRTRIESLIDARLELRDGTTLDAKTIHRVLGYAAIEGITWTAQVVAHASGCDPDDLMDLLDDYFGATSTDGALIEDRGFLAAAHDTIVNRYQFTNSLFWFAYRQYDQNPSEQQIAVAHALEMVYGGRYDDIAEQILSLYESAGQYSRATPYYLRRMYRPTALLPLLWQLDAVTPPKSNREVREYYRLMMECGRLYYEQGQYSHAHRMMEQVFGAPYPRTTDEDIQRFHLASAINLKEGRSQQAEQQARHVVGLSEAVFGNVHPATAASVNNLAFVLEHQGRYMESQALYERGLSIYEVVLGSAHPDTARSVNNLAMVMESQGQYGEAQALYERALAIHNYVLGPQHPDTAINMNGLAGVLSRQGRHGQAQALYEQSLVIQERVLGPQHPDTAITMHNLAGVMERQGQYGEAQALYERAVAVRKLVFGVEHLDTAGSMNGLAGVLASQGLYVNAQLLAEQVVSVRNAILGADHLDTATSMHTLASILVYQGRYQEAQPLYEQVLSINEAVLGAQHRHTTTSMHNLALVLERQGRYGEAQSLYERALTINEAVLGVDHSDTRQIRNSLAALRSTIAIAGKE